MEAKYPTKKVSGFIDLFENEVELFSITKVLKLIEKMKLSNVEIETLFFITDYSDPPPIPSVSTVPTPKTPVSTPKLLKNNNTKIADTLRLAIQSSATMDGNSSQGGHIEVVR